MKLAFCWCGVEIEFHSSINGEQLDDIYSLVDGMNFYDRETRNF